MKTEPGGKRVPITALSRLRGSGSTTRSEEPEMFKPEQVPLSNITDAWKVRCGCLYVFVKMPDNVTRTTFIPMPKTDREKCGSTHPDSTDRLFVPFQLTKEA